MTETQIDPTGLSVSQHVRGMSACPRLELIPRPLELVVPIPETRKESPIGAAQPLARLTPLMRAVSVSGSGISGGGRLGRRRSGAGARRGASVATEEGAWDELRYPRQVREALPLRIRAARTREPRSGSSRCQPRARPHNSPLPSAAVRRGYPGRTMRTLHSAFGVEITATLGWRTPKMALPASSATASLGRCSITCRRGNGGGRIEVENPSRRNAELVKGRRGTGGDGEESTGGIDTHLNRDDRVPAR